MHKYGHMLRENDVTVYDGQCVVIKDVWESKRLAFTAHGSYQGTRWVELWTFGPDVTERPIAIVRTGDFDSWFVETRYIDTTGCNSARR